ncbi:MAG TPA: bifunctional precorrin-2 dehydrogenase/sirohydrochlorin ferrochelatase [Parafilimonas sp.]|nr:bifunctional precorrin-2 dehydrogenase/sirohydrochlorin ferrochelatase [Parafilimonas sp.]
MAESNHLFPIFLKLEELNLLIVGGGNVALEKLNAVLSNSPKTNIRLVAREISDSIKTLVAGRTNIELLEQAYQSSHLENIHLVIAAVNDVSLAEQILNDAHHRNLLVNVADKPSLCDFYLSSVVQKGNLKLAISTNGKSPTIAKRLREIFSELLPEEIDEVLDNMQQIRNTLKGDFAEKVARLNEMTKTFLAGKQQ